MIPRPFHILRNEAAPAGDTGGGAPPAEAAPPAAAPAADPAAPPANVVHFKPDGSLEKGWANALGDEFAANAAMFEPFQSVADLARSYAHFRKTGPAYPSADSSPADVERFRALANVPADPAGYGLAQPAELPDGVTWDPEVSKKISDIAHKHHVPAPALQALMAAQIEIEGQRAAAERDARTKIEAANKDALVKEWRGDYEQNTSQARHMLTTLATQAGIQPDDGSIQILANVPAVAKLMLQVAKLTSEDHIRTPSGYGDLRTPIQRAADIGSGKDPEWGAKYQAGDKQAQLIHYQLLKEAEK